MTQEYATRAGSKLRLGIDDADDDDLLDILCGQVNAWMESPAAPDLMGGLGCAVGPSDLAELTLDGRDAYNDARTLFVRIGILRLASVEVDGRVIDDWVLRPLEQDRFPGWPAQQLWRTGGTFPGGFDNVLLVGAGESDLPDFGFEAIPLELVEVAEVTVAAAYYGKRSAQEEIGNPQQGVARVSRYVSGRDRDTLAAFRRQLTAAQGVRSSWLS